MRDEKILGGKKQMAIKSLSTDFVCAVLKESNLIDEKLVREIKLHENTYHKLLQQEAGANGSSPITAVDVISSMGLNSLSDQILSEELIMKTLAAHWKLPFLKIDLAKLDPAMVTSRVSESFALKHLTIPISISENMLFIAVVDPLDAEILETMRRVSTLEIRPIISTKTDILNAIEMCYGHPNSVKAMGNELSLERTSDESMDLLTVGNDRYADKHVVNTVNLILHYAFEQRTSEIHIDPKHHYSAIRFCIDGMLYDVKHIPLEVHENIILRLKALAGMDISERHKPQDGQTHFEFHDREIYLRISTMPVASGEKVVLRILDPIMLFRRVDELGFSPEELQQYMGFISHSSGIILVTGPAGSGKTTTIYSTLNQLCERGINITTIEKPIESVHEGFNQIAVQPHIGMSFETAIRHIVRQSPGVIMVGEMRNKGSVEQTVRAALAGHLVFGVLHTHDAPSAIVQLVDIGAQSFLLESTVIAVIAQRLVRKICDNCAGPTRLSSEERAELHISKEEAEKLSLRKGTGCITCRGTGYFGQTAVFEIMEVTDKLRVLIHNNTGAYALKNAAIEQGMRPLRTRAIEKMKAGITTSEEVLRVTGGLKGGIPHKFKSKILLDTE